MKDMTYEDLYLYCKNKNPDEKVIIYRDLGVSFDNNNRVVTPIYVFLEYGQIITGKQLSKTDLIFG